MVVAEKEKKKKMKMNTKVKVNATVIPAPRKSVKRMMLETMVGFLARLCFTSNSKYQVRVSSHMDRGTRHKKNKRIYATTDHT